MIDFFSKRLSSSKQDCFSSVTQGNINGVENGDQRQKHHTNAGLATDSESNAGSWASSAASSPSVTNSCFDVPVSAINDITAFIKPLYQRQPDV